MTDRESLTYAGAGVDIDAGNAMVEKIKPIVRATRRRGADAEIGGSEKPFAEDTATGAEKPDARAAFTAVPPTFQSTSTPIKP